jgi:hypothetical protein
MSLSENIPSLSVISDQVQILPKMSGRISRSGELVLFVKVMRGFCSLPMSEAQIGDRLDGEGHRLEHRKEIESELAIIRIFLRIP